MRICNRNEFSKNLLEPQDTDRTGVVVKDTKVIQLLAQGYTNHNVGARFNVTVNSVTA